MSIFVSNINCMKKLCKCHNGGVGMLLSPHILKSLNSIQKIQPKMIIVKFNSNPSTTIIFKYSPTNVSDETDLFTFYNELSSLVHSIPENNILIIGGDINPQIDKNKNNKFSLHNISNRNGEHLTDFSVEKRQTCLNTKFQKRKRKLWTYTYVNNPKAQIDYILMNKKWIKSTLSCEAYSSFEGVSSNHWIITAKIHLSLCRNSMLTTKTTHYDWSLLNNKDISNKYMISSMLFKRYPKHLLWMTNMRTLSMPILK